jgi:mRNA interferase RelE/StbE
VAFSVQLLPSAQRQLAKLDHPIRKRIAAAIDGLAEDPRPPGAKKLQGSDNIWRVRVGDYRILYEIHDRRALVLVVEIGHRREVYRLLSPLPLQENESS